ncbi:FAD-dependent monooxygenase [Pseudomonas sp. X10]
MRILIVGGGVAGLSLAIALEQRGIKADVVEQQASTSPSGTGLYLPGNAARAIEHLGLLERVREKAVPIENQRILDSQGRQLSNTRTRDVWAACGPCLSLPHATFHGMLRSALGDIKVRSAMSINAINQSAGQCEVVFTDGTSDVYDLVVGADGINSVVRKIAFPQVVPQYTGQVCWRFITQNISSVDCWTAMLGDGCTLLAIPVSPGEAYVYADVTLPASADPESLRHNGLATLYQGFASPVLPLVEKASDSAHIHFGRIGQVVMDNWVHGRVVLIGDAAHASSPSMAEGAGMAMEDAWVLAQALATEVSLDAALSFYTARRQPRVRWVQRQCAARDKMRTLPALARTGILRFFGDRLYRRSYGPLLAPV